MNKIIAIIIRNIRLILRSKSSALIILLGPLFILFAIGFAFNSAGDERINVGYLALDDNELSRSFISAIESRGSYVVSQLYSYDSCRDLIGIGKMHICIILPEDFRIDNQKKNIVKFIIDSSKVNYFQSVIDSIEKDFNEKALEYSYGMTTELLEKLNYTTEELKNKTDLIKSLKASTEESSDSLEKALKTIRNIETPDSSVDISELSVKEITAKIKKTAEDSLEEADSLIDEIDYELRKLHQASKINNTDREILKGILNESSDSIKELRLKLYNDLEDSKSNFDKQIADIELNLNRMQSQLNYAKENQVKAEKQVQELYSGIAIQKYKLEEVEKTFNILTANIDDTKITSIESILSPIEQEVHSIVSEDSQLNFYFPYLLILIICFVGILLGSSITIMDKTSPAYFRNFVTPTQDIIFLLGTYLTTMIIISFQVLFLLIIYSFYFGKDVIINLPTTILSLFIISSLFTLIGMFIGNLFQSEETSMLTSISIGSIMIFISDLIYPLERMPEHIAYIAESYNPFYVSSDLLRKVMVHKILYYQLYEEFLTIILLFIISVIIVIITFKLAKRHFLMRFSGYIARRDVRRMIREADQESIFDNLLEITDDKAFKAEDKKIRSLEELYDFIESLRKEDFRRYVTKEDNLFADWFSRILNYEALALKLYRTQKKMRTLKILKSEINSLQRYKKKITDTENNQV